MLSMTGFGRGSALVGDKRIRIEIRSVNHRGLDLKIRAREPDATVDAEITRAVRAAVERGAITVHLRDEASLDAQAAAQMVAEVLFGDERQQEAYFDLELAKRLCEELAPNVPDSEFGDDIAAHNPPRAANQAYSKACVGETIHRG